MSLPELSIRRPVFITMVLAALLVFGAFAYPRIGIDLVPNIEMPVATVLTIYPGAGPETVESEVTETIEEAVAELAGIDELRSVSVDNVSQVVVVFDMEVDADQAVQDVRDRVSRVIPALPSGAETPKVERLDLNATPVITLALSGPGRIDAVTEFARTRLKEPLQTVPGVGSVDVVGGQEREIKVWVDPRKLEASGLAVTDVVQAIAANNLEFPGGRFTSGETEFSVKVDGEYDRLDQIREQVVAEQYGMAIRVGDVAQIEDGFAEARSAASMSGERALTLVVRKQSGTNSVAVGDAIKAKLAALQADFPPGWEVIVATDMTLFTKASVQSVQFDLLFGGLLAVLIVFVFLRNGRSTLIAALALPTSVVGTFAFVWAMGFTFNTMTLLALTLSIGMLIDDAIVVLENIYRHLEQGKTARQAAADGANEIGLAVLATTLSIVAVFLPMALTEGVVGKLIYEFGLTVVVAVLISLLVSFTLTPMLSARFLTEPADRWIYRQIERVLGAIDRGYRRIIGWALGHRLAVVAVAVLVLAGTVSLSGMIGTEFMPTLDRGEFNVKVKLPTGTALPATTQAAEAVAVRIRELGRGEVLSTVVKVGADAQEKQNLAEIFVKLTDKQDRAEGATDLMNRLRRELTAPPGATVAVEETDMTGGSSGMRQAVIQYNLRGGDLAELDRYGRKLAAELRRHPAFSDVDTTYEGGKPEVRVVLDRAAAASQGVPTAVLGQSVWALVGGIEASKFREGTEEYAIRVRLAEDGRQQASQLEGLKVRSVTTGRLVDLASVADLETMTGPTQIDRMHRQKQVTVLANLTGAQPMSEAVAEIARISERLLPAHITTDYSGQVKLQAQGAGSLGITLLLALIVIYMVLASQFESFVHPFTIMVSLPLSVVGGLAGLLLSGLNLSIFAMIGMVMLAGLVTKNAILLVDYANILQRRDGFARDAALLEAGPTRLRPILMTTFAMIFGMLPVAISQGWGAEMRQPMAVCVIGGLVTSTLLTLIVVPVVYTLLDDLVRRVRRAPESAPAAREVRA